MRNVVREIVCIYRQRNEKDVGFCSSSKYGILRYGRIDKRDLDDKISQVRSDFRSIHP